MIVMKFGGTSVESAEAIERAAKIVASRRKRLPLVVVSAMAKVTDNLVTMGHNAASCNLGRSLELLDCLIIEVQILIIFSKRIEAFSVLQ